MKDQRRLSNYVNDFITPFDPGRMDKLEVYARIIEDSAEDNINKEEGVESDALLQLELFTKTSIEKAYEHRRNRDNNGEYESFGYYFTAVKDPNGDAEHVANRIIEKCKRTGGWIKGTLRKKEEGIMKGHLSLLVGLLSNSDGYNDDGVPIGVEASFVPDYEALKGYERTYVPTRTYDLFDDEENECEEIFDKLMASTTSPTPHFHSPSSGDETNNFYTSFPEEIPGLGKISDGDNVKYTVTIYKVGHGNAITIENDRQGDEYRCILFDCGTDRNQLKRMDTDYHNTKNTIIQSVKPTTIIISHIHSDHYSLMNDVDMSDVKLVVCPRELFDNRKNTYDFTESIRERLKDNEVKCVCPEGFIEKKVLSKYGYNRITIFKGKGWDPYAYSGDPEADILDEWEVGCIKYSNKDNDSGIILSIAGTEGHAILPGDCSYYSWPDEPELEFDKLRRLVVPHHGGNVYVKRDYYRSNCDLSFYISEGKTEFLDKIDYSEVGNVNGNWHRSFLESVCSKGKKIEYLITENLGEEECCYSFQI